MRQQTAPQSEQIKLVSGLRLFDKDVNQAEVVSMLLGYTAMPFEANPALFQSINAPPNAQNMLRQMLQRNPSARPALKDVSLHAWHFADVNSIAPEPRHASETILSVLLMWTLSSYNLCHYARYAEGDVCLIA